MKNSSFNSELYQEMCKDNGIQYDNSVDVEIFNFYMIDYK